MAPGQGSPTGLAPAQVDECRLDRGVPQPAREVVDLDAVHQQVARAAMPQGVCAYLAPGRDRPQLLSPPDRHPDPAPRRRRVNIDELPLTDAPIGEGRS